MQRVTILLALILSGMLSVVSAQSVFYEIRNEQTVTLGTDDFYQFDVFMRADVNGTFHSHGLFYIQYNTAAFGTYVDFNGNAQNQFLDLLDEQVANVIPKYRYPGGSNDGVDNSQDIYAVTYETVFPNQNPSSFYHTMVPDTFTPIIQFRLRILNSLATPSVSLKRDLMAGQQFMFVADQSPGCQGGGSCSPTFMAYGDGFLPVEFLNFDAQRLANEEVELQWATAREVNNSHFVIEKRLGENSDWNALDLVAGVGTTDETSYYNYVDNTPMGTVTYYRLRQVDLDGTFSYSDVVNVIFDDVRSRFTVYPSTAHDFATLRADAALEGTYKVQLSDMRGQVVRELTLEAGAPNRSLRIDMTQLAEGVYMVRSLSPLGESFVNRVVKVNR